jgi:hypothetical protein
MVNVTFYFNYFCISKLKNSLSTPPLFYLYWNSTIQGTPHTSNIQKNTTTMVEPFAGSSGVAMANQPMPSQYPLHGALFEGTVEGFCSTM